MPGWLRRQKQSLPSVAESGSPSTQPEPAPLNDKQVLNKVHGDDDLYAIASREMMNENAQTERMARIEFEIEESILETTSVAGGVGDETTAESAEVVPSTARIRPLYFMDSPTEGDRLELKTNAEHVKDQLRRIGLHSRMKALDIGCGSGAVTRVMAQLAAPAHVTGVDASGERLAQARSLARGAGYAETLTFIEGVATALPFENETFDFTHARMVFQYAPDPMVILAEMARVTKAGGLIAIADLDGQIERLYPMDSELRADLTDALAILATHGFDPHIGRKLYSLCHQAGLTEIAVFQEPYQVYVAGNLTDSDQRNWREKLETATSFLGDVTGDVARWARFRERYLTALHAPDAYYYATLFLVCGRIQRDASASP